MGADQYFCYEIEEKLSEPDKKNQSVLQLVRITKFNEILFQRKEG